MNWELDLGMQKMARYAAYQDRSRRELETKLRQIGCPEDKQEEVLEELARQGFWDEERFARSFARGKFRQKGWGKMKIRQGLWAKGVDSELVDLVLDEEIDTEEYQSLIEKELTKRLEKAKGEQADQKEPGTEGIDYEAQQKIIKSLVQRGFEHELVYAAWKDLS